jgi:hypothetical protein
MVGVVESLIPVGGLSEIGHMLFDAAAATFQSIKYLFDLPMDLSSLESSLRFVKKSGFENVDLTPVVAAPGIRIGGTKFVPREGSRVVSSASSTSGMFVDKSPPDPLTSSLDSDAAPKTGFASVVPKAMLVFLVLDILSLVLARQSAMNPCVSKLGIVQWVIVGSVLGFPATWLVDSVRREYSFRAAFVSELILIVGSFVWLCFGGATVFNVVSTCVDSIAPLWWLSYASSVLSLSIAGTVIFCMIVTTVLSLIYGSTQGK